MDEKFEKSQKQERPRQFDFNTPLSESNSPQDDQEYSETEMEDEEVKEESPSHR